MVFNPELIRDSRPFGNQARPANDCDGGDGGCDGCCGGDGGSCDGGGGCSDCSCSCDYKPTISQ